MLNACMTCMAHKLYYIMDKRPNFQGQCFYVQQFKLHGTRFSKGLVNVCTAQHPRPCFMGRMCDRWDARRVGSARRRTAWRARCAGVPLKFSQYTLCLLRRRMGGRAGQAARGARSEAHRLARKVSWGPFFAVQSEPTISVSGPRRMCGRLGKQRERSGRRSTAWRARCIGVPFFQVQSEPILCDLPAQEDVRAAGQAARAERSEADRVARKVYWGLLPLLTIMGVFIYLDRSNLSFISGQIIPALGLTSTDYGLGSGAHSASIIFAPPVPLPD